ncbi:response regulator transcription factor [Luteolibacter yonseiensis]|uniref:Response regulator transcription factor n=1 Tax=Luteolibacter yonseiensis TaxID=1144680 RepID=A0A934VAF4_9BACT|nr:response regulator transcription factor [Luteolibacter yonseiensis]MBK1814314.1 response regulator transcription factor [Luteolibacter yonseiensis]
MLEVSGNRRLLVVDDDRKLAGLIRDYLMPMGYEVELRHTGPEGLAEALAFPYEAVILDVMMPGMDGFGVLRELRKKSDVPVLMLTALGDEADRIVGLELGADDYLPKTFSSRELLARLRAVTRRARVRPGNDLPVELCAGALRLCEETHTVVLGEQVLDLTALEFAILTALLKSKGRVKTRERLIEEVSERRFDVYDRSIDVHVSSLRKKLGDDAKNPRFIRTIRGIGYSLHEPEVGDFA